MPRSPAASRRAAEAAGIAEATSPRSAPHAADAPGTRPVPTDRRNIPRHVAMRAPPRRDAMFAPMETTLQEAGVERRDRPHILIVEDDPEIGGMLAEALAGNGMQAVLATSAHEMQTRMARQPFDLVILDVMLPGEDGFSICRRLRAEHTIPIIMLTALGEEVDRILGIEIGADDYITKPFSNRELVARIRGLLRRASYDRERHDRRVSLRFDGWRVDPLRRQVHDPRDARSCLIPGFDGAISTHASRDALWARFTTGAPRRRSTRSRSPPSFSPAGPWSSTPPLRASRWGSAGGRLRRDDSSILSGRPAPGARAVRSSRTDADRPSEWHH